VSEYRIAPCECAEKMLRDEKQSADLRVYCTKHRLFARRRGDGKVVASRDPFKRDAGGNWLDVAGLSQRSMR